MKQTENRGFFLQTCIGFELYPTDDWVIKSEKLFCWNKIYISLREMDICDLALVHKP